MPPRPRRLDPAIPTERFALTLRELHRDAGKPKQQLLAAAMHVSHATVSAILNGHRFPSWPQTEAFVRACRGDVRSWRAKWAVADRGINSELAPPNSAEALPEMDQASLCRLTGREHFTSLAMQVRQTKHRILTTYLRVTPTLYYEGFTDRETGHAAREYFTEVVEWAAQSGARSVRRVVCLPNTEMIEWARELQERTVSIAKYEVRVLDWQINTDPINIAIFDDVATFLTFAPGTSPGAGGFRIDDREFVQDAVGYFGRLWSSSTRLEEHLLHQPGS